MRRSFKLFFSVFVAVLRTSLLRVKSDKSKWPIAFSTVVLVLCFLGEVQWNGIELVGSTLTMPFEILLYAVGY